MTFDRAVESIRIHLLASPEVARLHTLSESLVPDESTLDQILNGAASFAEGTMQPFDRVADRIGCRLIDGRVSTAQGHKKTWRAFVEAGWQGLEGPVDFGGAGLSLVVHTACEELFNRASASFGMLATPTRCAVKVIEGFGTEGQKREWLPKLVAGEWGATICISESDVGSDVARVRTMASPQADGTWRITGEKIWISFGDHDLTERIGHMLLARTPGAPLGSKGLSLFLVPSTVDGRPNGIQVRRIEEKLGLHASPTCALGFDEALGTLVGDLNKGLPQLFTMITRMRISVACQGAAIASACSDAAQGYARERRQGGSLSARPVTIDSHPDVRRMLMHMASATEVARGLALTTSAVADLSVHEDSDRSAKWSSLLGWLLPIAKNFCAEVGFDVANEAIQVFGGAGYTREWPVEQHLRDARVLSIYEGTTGIQALDLAKRRLVRDNGRGLAAFNDVVLQEIEFLPNDDARSDLEAVLDQLSRASATLLDAPSDGRVEATAYVYLKLASLAATSWIAHRLVRLSAGPVQESLAARGRHWLRLAALEAPALADRVRLGMELVAHDEAALR